MNIPKLISYTRLALFVGVIILAFFTIHAETEADLISRLQIRDRIVRDYMAKIKINGKKYEYKKDIFRGLKPKSSQFAQSDSCFYLTFELSPLSQKKGEKTAISVFMIFDSKPEIGTSYPIVTIPENTNGNENERIINWNRDMGNIVALQIAHMPLCKNYFAKDSVPTGHENDRIILNSFKISNGSMIIEKIEPYSEKSNDIAIKLSFDFDAVVKGDNDESHATRLSVRDAKVALYLVEHTELEPTLFPIDYGWGYEYIPANSFSGK